MKSLYQCERCGKIFTGENSYEDCQQHEMTHFDPADRYSLEEKPEQYNEAIIHSLVFDEKHLEPVSFIMFLQNSHYDNDHKWVTDTIERRYSLNK